MRLLLDVRINNARWQAGRAVFQVLAFFVVLWALVVS